VAFLSAAICRALEAPAWHVCIRGFGPLQQEHMVLGYVEADGGITRAQAAELCAIAPARVSRLLRRLAGQGKLVWCRERRCSRYELPTS
jgi:ATP-dependent DNA helicase RecG